MLWLELRNGSATVIAVIWDTTSSIESRPTGQGMPAATLSAGKRSNVLPLRLRPSWRFSMKGDQCWMLFINGIACHEFGSSNTWTTWFRDLQDLVLDLKCVLFGC